MGPWIDLKFYQFEVLVIIVAFLCSQILRSAILFCYWAGRSDLDFYLSLDAASDLLREATGRDEITEALGAKPRRKFASVKYASVIALCVIVRVALTIAVPLAVLNIKDTEVVMKAVDFLDSVQSWSGESERTGLDLGDCLRQGHRWEPPQYKSDPWTCMAHANTTTLMIGEGNLKDERNFLKRDGRIDQVKCNNSCVIEITVTRASMFKLREGRTYIPSINLNRKEGLMIRYNAKESELQKSQSSPATESDCPNKTSIKEEKGCVSARFLAKGSSENVTGSIRVKQVAYSPAGDYKELLYHVEKQHLENVIEAAHTGSMKALILNLTKKITMKKLAPGTLEYKLNDMQGAKVIVRRKRINTKLLIGIFGGLIPIFVTLKLVDHLRHGSESERSKFRRSLAALHHTDMSGASSYELRNIDVKGIESIDGKQPLVYQMEELF